MSPHVESIGTEVASLNRRSPAFEKLDANGDNGLDRDELPSVASFDFERADSNDDGRLSAFEFTDSSFMKFDRFDLWFPDAAPEYFAG